MLRFLWLAWLLTSWATTLPAQSLSEFPASFNSSRFFRPALFMDRPGAFSARRPADASILRFDVYAPYRPTVSLSRYYESVTESPRGLDAAARLYPGTSDAWDPPGTLPIDSWYGSSLSDPSAPFGSDIYWRGYYGR